MTDMKTTLLLVVIAVVLGIAALFAVPSSVEPEVFSDQGELFFPEFTDPFTCREIEIYEPDAETGSVNVFNVKFENGLWQIPSHHGYPADAKERMALAATALIGLKKDTICSDRIEDRTVLSVEDPLDDASSIEGRGKRIVMKDGSGRVLADLIVGKKVEDSRNPADLYRMPRNFAYLRQPDRKRIYTVNLHPNPESRGETINDISTDFSDWIDTDLLHLESREIQQVVLHNYSVNEQTGNLENKEEITLSKNEEDGWSMDGIAEDKQVKEDAIRKMVRTLDSLLIAGVRPQPENLSAISLASMGFFLDRENNLYGNEGKMEIFTDQGIIYHLFFGEILYGTGKAITAGVEEASDEETGNETKGTENRYLFVKVSLDPSWEEEAASAAAAAEAEAEEQESAEPETVAEDDEGAGNEEEPEKSQIQQDHEKWQKKLEDAKTRMEELNLRFQKWYYVITGDSFNDLRQDRESLMETKVPDVSGIGEQPEDERQPIKRPSGLHYIDLERGSGVPCKDGDLLRILYTGWLVDGTQFDSNQDRARPFTFTLGEGKVVKGWEEGIRGLPEGAKRKLIIPPDLGYGEEGFGEVIPPGSWLIFDVEVINVSTGEE